jgi:PilZ domain
MSTTQDGTLVVARLELTTVLREHLSFDPAVCVFSAAEARRALSMALDGSAPVIALDRHFVTSPSGAQFLSEIRAVRPNAEIRILIEEETDVPVLLRSTTSETGRATIAAGSDPLVGEVRRAPRFPVTAGLEAIVNGEPAGLVNVSVSGAQVLSPRILKPTQYVRVALPDDTDALKVEGAVAWSTFERSRKTGDTRYRAGVAFTDAVPTLMEAYCAKHGINC